MAMILNGHFTQAEFGQLVGIGQPRVSDLLARGVLTDGAPAGHWLLEYCGHLRAIAAGREASGDLDLATERARLARAQAEWREILLAEKRGELVPVTLLEEVLSAAGAKVAGIFDGIPGAVRRRVPGLPASAVELIQSEVSRARNIVAGVTLRDLEFDLSAEVEDGAENP